MGFCLILIVISFRLVDFLDWFDFEYFVLFGFVFDIFKLAFILDKELKLRFGLFKFWKFMLLLLILDVVEFLVFCNFRLMVCLIEFGCRFILLVKNKRFKNNVNIVKIIKF